MSVEESVENELLAPVPRPIAERECACGCGVMFQPRRRDQIYLNSQHANYGYNHGKRKEKNKSRSKEEAILAKNDEVLNKHYKSERNSKDVVRYYDVLKADAQVSQWFRLLIVSCHKMVL
jgi:hypothetical protein